MEGNAFGVYATKATSNRVTLLKWSPIHKLVALVFEDVPLTLYRLPWKRVWSCHTTLPPKALCWSPNGEVLVVGFGDGSIQGLSKETGIGLFTLSVMAGRSIRGGDGDDGVECMTWRKRASHDGKEGGSEMTKEDSVLLFSDVPAVAANQYTSSEAIYKEFEKLTMAPECEKESEMDVKDERLLCVGRKSGWVTLFIGTRVPIAEFNAFKMSDANERTARLLEVNRIVFDSKD